MYEDWYSDHRVTATSRTGDLLDITFANIYTKCNLGLVDANKQKLNTKVSTYIPQHCTQQERQSWSDIYNLLDKLNRIQHQKHFYILQVHS